MDAVFSLTTPAQLVSAALVAVLAGFIKGAVGFAMPLVMVSGMSLFLEPTTAIAGMIFSIVVSNLWQSLRGGIEEALDSIREHWRYIAIVCGMIVISAQFVTSIPGPIMYLVLGIPVTALTLVQLYGLRLTIPPGRRRRAELPIAAFAGMMGGLAGTWGPPTVMYLMALDTPKARQIAVQGVVYGLGAVTLLAAHLGSGVLNRETIPFSAILLIPALTGMQLGFWMSDRMNPVLFRKLTLAVLAIAGLNLIRRGIVGL